MSEDSTASNPLMTLVDAVATANDSDVILYSGSVGRRGFEQIARICADQNRRENAILFLSTYGGDAHAGYRIARSLRRTYKHVAVFVHGICKSAGTLIAVGAHELIISDFGELGPLDVQIQKDDEIFGETGSGLNLMQALSTLNKRTYSLFEDCLLKIKVGSGGQLTTKSATEVATKMAVGVYSEIYRQIDPVRLGEIDRAINIAFDYGKRLDGNLKQEALASLVVGYPSHGFVIDREEAEELFDAVRPPDNAEAALADYLSDCLDEPRDELLALKLNAIVADGAKAADDGDVAPQTEESTDEKQPAADRSDAGRTGTAVGTTAGQANPDASESVGHAAVREFPPPEASQQ